MDALEGCPERGKGAEGFKGEIAYGNALRLCFPRRTGSKGAEETRRIIAGHFKELDLELIEDDFSSPLSPLLFKSSLFLIAGIGSIVAGEICGTRKWISWGIALAIILLCPFIGLWPRWISRIFEGGKRRGRNIVAIYGNPMEVPRTICIMAHYDTKSSLLPLGFRLLAIWLSLSLLLTSSILIPLGIQGWARAFLLAAGIIGIILSLDIPGNGSPGAIDNASGLGTMMEIGRVVSLNKPKDVGFIFVATDAEEDGMIGALRFARKFKESFSSRNILFINIDMLSGSRWIGISGRRGSWLAKRIAKALRSEGLRPLSIPCLLGAGADHIPLIWAGFEAVTVHGLGSIWDIFKVHTSMDTPESLSPNGMERIGKAITNQIFYLSCGNIPEGSSPEPPKN